MKMYGMTTVSAKGQVVIPAKAREALELEEGDELVVMSTPENKGVILFKAEVFESTFRAIGDQFADMSKQTRKKAGK